MELEGQLCRIFFLCLLAAQQSDAEVTQANTNPGSADPSYFFYQQSEYPRDCREVHDQCSASNSSGVYYIKPDGYFEPFEVFCDNTEDLYGWVVILRRQVGGIINFDRDWESYKNGFGFLAHEFWIGNERLSYITNQNNYQLLIEATLLDGSKVTVSYNNFRIGDSFSQYSLVGLSYASGTADNISWCPLNMVYDNCTCGQRTCADPNTCQNTCAEGQSSSCICPEGFHMNSIGCVPQQHCGCYVPQEQIVIPDGETYVNNDCTRITTCSSGHLTRNELYQCSPNAACEERDGERNCYCNEGYSGDGQICDRTRFPKDCLEVYNTTSRDDGVYTIKPTDWPGTEFEVYCNMTDGGGWTVFQRRQDGQTDFFLDWDAYKNGFGDLSGEHWLGNEQLYYLTNQGTYQIRIDLVNQHGAPYYAKYDSFRINNENDNYRLSVVGSYSGTAGGSAFSNHRNYQFSTKDRDHDTDSRNCAQNYHGAWWYYSCHNSHLNGDYDGSGWSSIAWNNLPGGYYNIRYTEMKIRPV